MVRRDEPGHRHSWRCRGAVALTIALTASLLCTSLLPALSERARARAQAAPSFRVEFSTKYFGKQFLHATANDLSHPDAVTFTISSYSELWYGLQVYSTPSSLRPVPADPLSDIISAFALDENLLPPAGILPINGDLSFLEQVKVAVHFTQPGQQVQIVLNPNAQSAWALSVVRLLLMLVGQQDTAEQAGLLIPGAVRQIVDKINAAPDLAKLVKDFVSLVNAASQRNAALAMIGPAHACVVDILHLASNAGEAAMLVSIFALARGKKEVVNITPILSFFISLGDATKYLIDLALSFANYVFQNDYFPTIILTSVGEATPPAGGVCRQVPGFANASQASSLANQFITNPAVGEPTVPFAPNSLGSVVSTFDDPEVGRPDLVVRFEILAVCSPEMTADEVRSFFAAQMLRGGWYQSTTYPYGGNFSSPCGDPYCWAWVAPGSDAFRFASLESVRQVGSATMYQMRLGAEAPALASYVGDWFVHGESLTINSDGSGHETWNAGPCTPDPTAADVQLCSGNATIAFAVNADGSITGTYQSVQYTQPDGSPPPPDFQGGSGYPAAGDTFGLKLVRAHLLSAAYPDGESGYFCDMNTSSADRPLCGA